MVDAVSFRDRVWARAKGTCEYCRVPETAVEERFHVDHVRAQQHRGKTVFDNLALACSQCNLHKGANLAGIDPESDEIVLLFNPRTDQWNEHFAWRGATLVGLTALGRATVETLAINSPDRVQLREQLIQEGLFFTSR